LKSNGVILINDRRSDFWFILKICFKHLQNAWI